jgi:hypothetical protein
MARPMSSNTKLMAREGIPVSRKLQPPVPQS